MKNFLPTFLKAIFVLLILGLVLAHKMQTPRILIVHSYLDDYDWTQEINIGLDRVFEKHPGVIVRYHYMNLKNQTEERYRETSSTTVHRLIRKWKPDTLILFDDWAQKLIGVKYINSPDMNIVFAGVNAEIEKYGYEKANNVTGILERKPLDAIKETALMILNAQKKDPYGSTPCNLVFIGDKSFGITNQIPYFSNYDWSPLEWLTPVQVDTFAEWKQAVKEAEEHADMIMLANYQQVRIEEGSKKFVRPVSIVMTWTEENSTIPVIGSGSGQVAEGGMITVPVSGYEQGEVAATMAIDIAAGKSPSEIPVVRNRQFLISLRKSAMEKRELPIPTIYEAFARATEKYYD